MAYYSSGTLYFDGACRGNPGAGGCGWVFECGEGIKRAEGCRYLGSSDYTNNVAEYFGLMEGLKFLRKNDVEVKRLYIKGDSELVINHLNGSYRVRSNRLRPLYSRTKQMLASFDNYEVEHIYREDNSEADGLANQAIDTQSDQADGWW